MPKDALIPTNTLGFEAQTGRRRPGRCATRPRTGRRTAGRFRQARTTFAVAPSTARASPKPMPRPLPRSGVNFIEQSL